MKEEDQLPANLLRLKPPLPLEVYGAGQLCRGYNSWAYANCAPEHMPVRKTAGAAGHALSSVSAAVVPAGGSVMINTGLSVALPKGHFGKIEGRSSLGIEHSVVPFGGIIDEDYRGVVMVKLFNHGPEDYHIQANDRIAQLVVQKYSAPIFQLCKELSATKREGFGFGSTGR